MTDMLRLFWGASTLLLLFVCVAGGCGGGSHDSSADSTDNVGIGWIEFTNPSPYGSFVTDLTSVSAGGTTFTNEDAQCFSLFSGTLGPGYSVFWENTANGSSGEAVTGINCISIGFAYWHVSYGVIPLEPGDNVLKVTASDRYGNIGRNSITISRVADSTAPIIMTVSPSDGQVLTGLIRYMTATFSEEMLSSSLNSNTFYLQDSLGTPVPGTVAYDPWSRTATLSVVSSLDYHQTYTVILTSGAVDLGGSNPLATDVHWSFTTGPNPDVTPPTVTSTNPVAGSYCVSATSIISATFDEPLLPSSVNTARFILRDPEGSPVAGEVACLNSTVSFTPQTVLAENQSYTSILTAGITDLAGNSLASDFAWSFAVAPAYGVGEWSAVTSADSPSQRAYHTAVWTGNEMIVSGGFAYDAEWNRFAWTTSGARYNPLTRSWSPITDGLVPQGHRAVWTGSEMLKWGGGRLSLPSAAGGRYDPVADHWTPLSADNVPSARYGHSLIWTGTGMLIWGGVDNHGVRLNTGGRYDPETDSWTPISTVGAPSARYGQLSIWTGEEMIVWGGSSFGGGRYHPATDSWQPMSTYNAPNSLNFGGVAVWTGSEMLVWGDEYGGSEPGGRYNPDTDSWQLMDAGCQPNPSGGVLGAWTGERLIVWGAIQQDGHGGIYDPQTDTWSPLAATNAPDVREDHTLVWTGESMIVWGGRSLDGSLLNSGAVFSP